MLLVRLRNTRSLFSIRNFNLFGFYFRVKDNKIINTHWNFPNGELGIKGIYIYYYDKECSVPLIFLVTITLSESCHRVYIYRTCVPSVSNSHTM